MTIDQLMQRITDLENRVQTLETDRSADSLHNKITFHAQLLEDMTLKLSQHDNLFKQDENCIEVFTDSDLMKWYKASGLFVADVQKFINGTPEQANALLHGKYGDDHLRSKVGKWFRTRAIKHNTEHGI